MKKGSSVTYVVKKFHQYVFGQSFKIITDHKPLPGLFYEHKEIPSMTASGMQGWVIILSLCNYEFVFHPGVKHGNSISMSKLPFQNDNLEKGSVLENKVFMIELCILL